MKLIFRNRHYSERHDSQQGFAFITALAVMAILAIVVVAFVRLMMSDVALAGYQRTTTEAFYLAEAGAQEGLFRVKQGFFDSLVEGASQTFESAVNSGVNVEVWVLEKTTERVVYEIISRATVRGIQRSIRLIVAKENSSLFNDALLGCDGVSVSSNGKTSSYSSAGAPTSGNNGNVSTTNPDADIRLDSNAEIKGDVRALGDLSLGSNAIIHKSAYSNGNITLDSNAQIGYDDQNPPYDTYEAKASGNITLGSEARIYGTQTPNVSPPPVSPPACDPLNIDDVFATNADPIKVLNNNNELNSAYFKGSRYNIGSNNTDVIGTAGQEKKFYLANSGSEPAFGMDSNAKVTIQGNVTMYVDGDFSMNSNTEIIFGDGAKLTIYVSGNFFLDSNTKINDNGIPSNLQIYSSAQSSSNGDYKVKIDSNSGFAGIVYAPRAAVRINSNGQIEGSVRGKYVSMDSNGEFRYDEELKKIIEESLTTYKILSWAET